MSPTEGADFVFEQLVWIVPIAVALAGIWRPRGGLLVLAASLPLFGAPPGGPYLAALDASAIVAIVLAWRADRVNPSAAGLGWPLASLVVVSVVSLVPFAYLPPSFEPVILSKLVTFFPNVSPWSTLYPSRAFVDLLLGCALYFAVRRAFGRCVAPLGVALGAGLALASIAGLLEHAGLVHLGVYRAIDQTLHATRLHSFFFHSGWLAEYVVLATPLAVASLLAAGGKWRVSGVALLVLAMVTLMFTEQRGAWFAALAQTLTLVVLMAGEVARDRAQRRRVLGVAIGVGCVILLVIGTNPDRARPLLDRVRVATSDLSGRTHLWSASAELIQERPVLGWGLGSFATAYDVLRPRGSTDAWLFRDTAHSTYLNVAAERGTLGLAAFAIMACAILPGIYRAAHRGSSAKDRGIALALLVTAVGGAVNAIVQDLFYLRSIHWLCWIVVAAAAPFAMRSATDYARTAAKAITWAAIVALPWRALASTSPPQAGNRSFGFHELERSSGRSLEWTTGYAARRIAWQDAILVIRVANGHPRADRHSVDVSLRAHGQEIVARDLPGGWSEHRLHLGAPTQDWIVLEIEARPTFRPFSEFQKFPELPSTHDFRSLGVALGEIKWESSSVTENR